MIELVRFVLNPSPRTRQTWSFAGGTYSRPQLTDANMDVAARNYSCKCCVQFLFKRVHSPELRYLVLQLLQDMQGNELTDTPEHMYDLWMSTQP